MTLRMGLNENLFTSQNLDLDPDNPCSDPINSIYVDDVNTGTLIKDEKARECSLPNHIIMPFCQFIDGLNIDKYEKLTVEAVLICCLFWFNKKYVKEY